MDGEEITDGELKALINRFEQNHADGDFDYYTPENLTHLIDYYIEKPNYRTALKAAQIAIEQHPYDATFYAKKGFIHTITDNTDKALQLIDVALDLDPNHPDYLAQRGSILELMNRPLEALEQFDMALEQGASTNDILVLKMFVYFNIGNTTLAINMIEQIFSSKVEEDRLILESHFCLQLMDAYEDGVRIFTAYLDSDPYHEVVWLTLGQIYMGKGDHDAALSAFDFALAIDDEYAEAHFERGQCLVEQSNYLEASKSFDEYIKLEGADQFAYVNLGDCYKAMNRISKSRMYYKLALKTDPKFGHAWHGLGQTYAMEEKHAEALSFFKKANNILPDDEYILLELVKTQITVGLIDEAETKLEEMTDTSPYRESVWLLLASLQHQYGQTAVAINTLQEALKLIAKSAKLLYKLSAYCFLTDKSAEGFERLTDALLLSFEEHELLFSDAPGLAKNKAINDIIDLYRNEK